jgi:hypothetical protein
VCNSGSRLVFRESGRGCATVCVDIDGSSDIGDGAGYVAPPEKLRSRFAGASADISRKIPLRAGSI